MYFAEPTEAKDTVTSFEAAAFKVAVTLKVSFSAILSCDVDNVKVGFSILSKNKVALSVTAVALVIVATLNTILANASTKPSTGISDVEIVRVPKAEFAGIVIVLLLNM